MKPIRNMSTNEIEAKIEESKTTNLWFLEQIERYERELEERKSKPKPPPDENYFCPNCLEAVENCQCQRELVDADL